MPISVHRKRKGQALILVTTAVVPMIALVGLVADVGYMYFVKNTAQAAADSAALAAVYRYQRTLAGQALTCSSYDWVCRSNWPCPSTLTSASNPVETACLYAKQNGFDPSDSKKSVTITSNVTPTVPTAPGVGGVGYWITVRAKQRVPQLFSAVMGNMEGTVVARASGAFSPGLGCVYTLDPSAAGSFTQNGSTQFKAACGVYVNSDNPAALLGLGGATLQTSTINVVGGYDWQGVISPVPNTGVTPTPDPLIGLQPPIPCSASGGCPSADCTQHPNTVNVMGNTTLFPGTYCGGIRVKNGTANFSPGTYILVGGGISTQDANSHIVGNGLFFYNTYNATNAYKPVDFNANSSVQIAAANTGDHAGVLFMQDRNCCATTMPTESFQGGATSFFEGILYMPRSLVEFAGNPSLDIAHYTIVIARRFSVKGTSTMNNDFSHLQGGNPIKQAVLVE